jgi:hypothetical protein
MKNISEIFRKVISIDTTWKIREFYDLLNKFDNNNFEISYWKGEENWASILLENKTIGYIWKNYPLIIIEKHYAKEIKELAKCSDLCNYVEVEALNKDLFEIDDNQVRKTLNGFMDFNSFTMEDLWFTTNSI